jgi:hypothetical protein
LLPSFTGLEEIEEFADTLPKGVDRTLVAKQIGTLAAIARPRCDGAPTGESPRRRSAATTGLARS